MGSRAPRRRSSRRKGAASRAWSYRKIRPPWAREREDLARGGGGHALSPPPELAPGAVEVAAQALLEPRPRWSRAWLAAQGGELAPEVGPWVGVSLDAPAGAARAAAAASALDPERLVREIGAEPVQADARERPRRVVEVAEGLLEELDVGGRLLVRVTRRVDRVDPVEAAADRREAPRARRRARPSAASVRAFGARGRARRSRAPARRAAAAHRAPSASRGSRSRPCRSCRTACGTRCGRTRS